MSAPEPARYEQIARYLRKLIQDSEPGDRLPSDAELCEKFGVSRMTARQAVQVVAADGSIERRRGAGTFVRSRPVPRDLGSPLSFTEAMRARGMQASSRTLAWGPVAPTEDERTALGLEAGERAYALERLRFADATPMAIERAVMPEEVALSLEGDFDFGSLHEAFQKVGRVPERAHAEVTAHRANKTQRELLGLSPTGIVICERRTIFDQHHEPLERTVTCYAPGRFSFRAVLVRDTGTPAEDPG